MCLKLNGILLTVRSSSAALSWHGCQMRCYAISIAHHPIRLILASWRKCPRVERGTQGCQHMFKLGSRCTRSPRVHDPPRFCPLVNTVKTSSGFKRLSPHREAPKDRTPEPPEPPRPPVQNDPPEEYIYRRLVLGI